MILFLGFYDSFLLLIIILPWTTLLYVAFTYRGFRFSDDDVIYQYSGKLYWVGKGAFRSTLVALLNLLLSAILIPNSTLRLFDSYYGPLTSYLILIIIPLPGFLLISMEKKTQETLYELLYQQICLKNDEIPLFIVLTNELITNFKPYSDEYFEKLAVIRQSLYEHLTKELPQIEPFVNIESSYCLNLDHLAMYMAKKTFKQDVTTEIKNID